MASMVTKKTKILKVEGKELREANFSEYGKIT